MSSEDGFEIARHEEFVEKAIIEGDKTTAPVSHGLCLSDEKNTVVGKRCYVVVCRLA